MKPRRPLKARRAIIVYHIIEPSPAAVKCARLPREPRSAHILETTVPYGSERKVSRRDSHGATSLPRRKR